ncbi:MAG: hypothetical protein Q8L42_11695, partial [Sulfurimicrobium sp.]|nr:hypothetical protein [Sulfurimicrobium sp.]
NTIPTPPYNELNMCCACQWNKRKPDDSICASVFTGLCVLCGNFLGWATCIIAPLFLKMGL